MTLFEDLANDYQHIADIETVTVTDRSGSTSVATVKADRQDLSHREVQLGGQVGIEPNDMVWRLWSSTLDGLTPDQGDTVTDSELVIWTILSLTEKAYATTSVHYRAVCRQQRYS